MALETAVENTVNGAKQLSLRGLTVAAVTTFDEDESLNLDAFKAHLEFLLEAGVHGICVAGTTGEAHALSFDERKRLLRAAARVCEGRAVLVAGAGATTTLEARRLVSLASDCGCSAALVLTPWFEPATEDSLLRYYADVVDAARLPILLYHNPSRTKLDWEPESIARIVAALGGSRVIGIKDSAAQISRVERLRELVPASFQILSGAPYQWQDFKRAGADGNIDGTSNLIPAIGRQLLDGSTEGQAQYAAVAHCLERSQNYIALIKVALEKLGRGCGWPRKPLDLADGREYAEICDVLRLNIAASDRSRVSVPKPQLPQPLLSGTSVAGCIKLPLPAVGTPLARASEATDRYAHHPCITVHNGLYVAAWSSGIGHEDSAGQIVKYATSTDGKTWSEPLNVMPRKDVPERWTAGGLWASDDGLRLLCVRYTSARYVDGESSPGMCWENLATDVFRWTGRGWKAEGLFAADFYANEAPRRLRDGRWMSTGVNGRHDAVAAISTDPTGTKPWETVVLSARTAARKLTEPSWQTLADGTVRVLLRDDGGSRRIWCCESQNGGRTFSVPVMTDLTDARAKFFMLRLLETQCLICNPSPNHERRLLAVALAAKGDGGDKIFSKLLPLRFDPGLQPRFAGKHKLAGFQYPNACVAGENLHVIYSVNKEDIEVQTIPVGDVR